MNTYIGRYAPSPTGDLHLGNIFSVLIAYARAKQKNGKFLLRIEDIDEQRIIEGSQQRIIEDLEHLGIKFDEPAENLHQKSSFVQTERHDLYELYLSKLEKNKQIYVCECSRRDIREASSAPHGPSGVRYQGTCKNKKIDFSLALENPENYSIRLKCPNQHILVNDLVYGEHNYNIQETTGDFILKRKLSFFAYQFVVVVDDALMKITEVVRGNDLLESSAGQQYLYKCLGFEQPKFAHHPILLDFYGTRLSKRFKPETFRSMLKKDYSIQAIIGIVGASLGLCADGEELSLEIFIDALKNEHLQKEFVYLPKHLSKDPL